jgi:hypothetical protein
MNSSPFFSYYEVAPVKNRNTFDGMTSTFFAVRFLYTYGYARLRFHGGSGCPFSFL